MVPGTAYIFKKGWNIIHSLRSMARLAKPQKAKQLQKLAEVLADTVPEIRKGIDPALKKLKEGLDKIAETAGKTADEVPLRRVGPKARRPHRELVEDFKKTPQDWERTGAQAGQTAKGPHKGSLNVETQWRNKKTGEEISTHEVIGSPRGNPHPENISPNLPQGGAIRPRGRAKEF